jgi:hypothetical protein
MPHVTLRFIANSFQDRPKYDFILTIDGHAHALEDVLAPEIV